MEGVVMAVNPGVIRVGSTKVPVENLPPDAEVGDTVVVSARDGSVQKKSVKVRAIEVK